MSYGLKKIRILLADDHEVMRVGLSVVIAKEPDMEVVDAVENGIEAVDSYCRHIPDVVIMDLRMPEQGGIETICVLREEYRDVRILVYSGSVNREQIYTCFAGGASGFVGKDMPPEKLLKAIRTIHQGVYYIPPEILTRIGLSPSLSLSSREMRVLGLVAKGMSNREIGAVLRMEEVTVKIHVTSILAKLGVSDRNRAVLIAMRRGILQVA